MKRFFKYLLTIFLGSLISCALLFLIFIITISALASKSKKPIELKSNSVYLMKLDRPIQERAPENIFNYLDIFPEAQTATLGLNDIIENIEKAKHDSHIKGIVLNLSYIQAGMATTSAIRNALENFKASGKFIIAYGDYYDKKAYLLASVADKVYMNPMGVLEFMGIKSEISFFKGLFDKLEIEPTVFRVGKFKSYGERYDSKKLSPENKKQIDTYVNGIWQTMLNEISISRGISIENLNTIASNMDTDIPEKTVTNKLIDSLVYWDQVVDIIKTECNISLTSKLHLLSHKNLTSVPEIRKHRGFVKEKIAVVYAWGNVQMGKGDEGNIGADRIAKTIRKARKDSSVKAVVLRVNSGGGSALASEIIWREMDLTSKVKPVVASMGDVAASGGYYILAPAQYVMANPYTITGSIGVIGILYNAQDFFNNKLGITHEVVKTNPHADFGSVFRPMEAAEQKSMNNMLSVIYHSFVGHVADARNMTFNDVNEIAQGRVWLANDALNNNLIDGLGNLNDAIAKAAELAEIEKYRVVEWPHMKEPLENLLDDVSKEVAYKSNNLKFGPMAKYIDELYVFMGNGKFQTILPYNIDFN